MRAAFVDGEVCVWMTTEEAPDLLRELDKWPELPRVEADLVQALKGLEGMSQERDPDRG